MAKKIQKLIESDVTSPEFLKLFPNILNQDKKQKCDSIRHLARGKVFNKFVDYLNKVCMTQDTKAYNSNSFGTLIDMIMNVCTFVLENCSDVLDSEDFHNLFSAVKKSVVAAHNKRGRTDTNVLFKLDELKNLYNDTVTKTKKSAAASKKKAKVAAKDLGDFRELALIPSSKEVNQKNFNAIRAVLVGQAYESVEKYLNDQFRLVREDFVGTVRIGLKAYREGQARNDYEYPARYDKIRVYNDVHFVRSEYSKIGAVAYLVNFDPYGRIKNANYETNRMFMQGSLVLFSRNEFQNFFCAVVHYPNVNILNSGKVFVTVEQNGNFNEDFLYHPCAKFMMIEPDIFWKPYSSILQVLKRYAENCFPMRKYIVETCTQIDPPAYLSKFPEWNVFGHPTKPLNLGTWPAASYVGLDEHQYEALQTALTKKFCVIQGPPGTGKTFLGLKIIQSLLQNMDEHRFYIRNPILVICFTNHALDQFLEGILEFDERIIRVGGQSRSELLDRYNFKEKKALRVNATSGTATSEDSAIVQADRKTRHMIGKGRKEGYTILSRIDKLNENLQILSKPKGILKFECLKEVMEEKHSRVLNSDFSFVTWLLAEKESTYKFNDVKEFDFLDDLEAGLEIDQKALQKEMYGELFKTEEGKDVDEDVDADEDETLEEELNYHLSLEGLIKVCLHYKKELHSIVDQESGEYTSAMRGLTPLVQRYFILKENLSKTLVDETLLEKAAQMHPVTLPLDHRWNKYFHWVETKKAAIKAKINHLKNEFHATAKNTEKYQLEQDLTIFREAAVVGMTTTGAAGYHDLLQRLKPSVVVVEEAAQVMEAHIVASLNEFTEHVVLIGDHKQLRPFTGVDELSKKYNLGCSLFERIINNGFYCPTLWVQHRMRPEISSLLRPSIYAELKDHDSVLEYDSIRGMQKNVFFIDHNNPESVSVDDRTSYQNHYEADFALELCQYLINQDYNPESITLLTTYATQNFQIKQRQARHVNEKVAAVRSCVVDDYQGKENDIIILSLVRSNPEGKIGFLKEDNRVCVALSRAKKGFYILGNMTVLFKTSPLWQKVRKKLKKDKQIGAKLTLCCSKHGTLTEVETVSDFDAVKGGGCKTVCGDVLPCGHTCSQPCHVSDPNHADEYACKEKQILSLECGHFAELSCDQKKEYVCKVKVLFRSLTCNHLLTRECCNKDLSSIICTEICERPLPCEHLCQSSCHSNDEHAKYQCQEICGKENPNCPEYHRCRRKCGEPCGECLKPQIFELDCGHKTTLPCFTSEISMECTEVCGKPCPECHLPCQKLCWEECKPCINEVEKVIEECDHFVNVPCSVTPSRKMCNMLLSVTKKSRCGHDVTCEVPCGIIETDFEVEDYLLSCEVPCETELPDCGHKCSGTCGRCLQGRLHLGCGKRCNKDLVCGHKCRYACGEICPPCSEDSLLGCSHTDEKPKCGESYANVCSKPCPWRCEHEVCTNACGDMCDRELCYQPCPKQLKKCGHPCIGFCGEPCPSICRKCDGDAEIAEHARYVMLEDCGCVFESHQIENELYYKQARSLHMYRCPQCEQFILNTKRFMNRVRMKYSQIMVLNKRVYGLGSEWATARNLIVKKLDKFGGLKEKDLPGSQRIREQLMWAARNKYRLMNEHDMVIISYFVDMFSLIGRRFSASNFEPDTSTDYQRGTKLVSWVLNRVDVKMLLYDSHTMNGLRGELIRMHRILDYRTLLRGIPVERLEEDKKLRDICEKIRCKIFEPIVFEMNADAGLDALFKGFLSIEPKNVGGGYSFENSVLRETKWSNFLDKVSLSSWCVCKSNHFYHTFLQNATCREC